MTGGAPTLGGLRRFNTVTVQNLTVTGNLTTSGSISDGSDITLANGKALQSDTTTGHTAVLKAYDVDGTAYKTFATLTNGNTPSFAIAAPSGGTVTIDGAVIGGTTPLAGSFTTLNATGAITGGSSSDIAINTNKFTVAASTGNTLVGGTLDATGAATAASISTTGGHIAKSGTAVPASSGALAAGAAITMFSTGIKIWVTSDTPSFSATKGDLCLNTGGSSSSTRLFINNGTTNWVAITTAS